MNHFEYKSILILGLLVMSSVSNADFNLEYFYIAPNVCGNKATVVSRIASSYGAILVWKGMTKDKAGSMGTSYEIYNSSEAWVITEDRFGKSCVVDYGYHREQKFDKSSIPECHPSNKDFDRPLKEFAGANLKWVGTTSDMKFSYSLYLENSKEINRNRWALYGALPIPVPGQGSLLRAGCDSVLGDTFVQVGDF